MRIRDLMTKTVVSVAPATPVRDVARLLGENRISGLLVVDADGTLLGVVSEADFLVEAAHGGEPRRPSLIARLFGRTDELPDQPLHQAATAADLMTSPAMTIGPGEAPAQAAVVMTSDRVNRLPVVEDGRLVGIVTRADLVRSYVRSGRAARGVIREDVLVRHAVARPEDVRRLVATGSRRPRPRRQAVVGGHDHAGGRAGARGPGVVSDVTWTVDDERAEVSDAGPGVPVQPGA